MLHIKAEVNPFILSVQISWRKEDLNDINDYLYKYDNQRDVNGHLVREQEDKRYDAMRLKMELATSLEARAEYKKLFSLLVRILKMALTIFNWTEDVSSMKQKNLKSFTESQQNFNLKKFTQTSQYILI